MRPGLLLLPLLLPLIVPGDSPAAMADPHAAIRADPIPLDTDRPWLRRVGKLRAIGAWRLSSLHPRFGGLSAMVMWRGRLLGVSDEGYAIAFTATAHGLADPYIRPLPVLGRRVRKIERDTESLAIDPASGRLWVGTENNNSVWRFAPGFARLEAAAAPPAMRRWPINGGAESMARLADGRFLVIAEYYRGDGEGTRRALLFPGDPTDGRRPLGFSYRPPAGCVPSEAAALPDGRVLVLNRCLSLTRGFSAKLVRIDLARIAPRAVIAGEAIATFARPLAVDNMEALAVVPQRRGVELWIASDDNFSMAQRTLLMRFRLDD